MLRAARGKRGRGPVTRFLASADKKLERLRHELLTGNYRPSNFAQFSIRDPKPRLISCADFRDRVVHHALCDVIGPLLERSFIPDSFACRVGKGAHRAVLRAQTATRRWAWFAKLDIRRYFDSIDHDILLGVLQTRFREAPVRALLETVVRFPLPGQQPGKGLPIGNLTSQWFANTYLDGLDHRALEYAWGSETLAAGSRTGGVGFYLRYMDDLLIFDESADRVSEHVRSIVEWLQTQRHLTVKMERPIVGPCRDGVPFLGWRVFPGCLRLQPGRLRRSRRLLRQRERECRSGAISMEALTASARAITAGIKALRPAFRFDRWFEVGVES